MTEPHITHVLRPENPENPRRLGGHLAIDFRNSGYGLDAEELKVPIRDAEWEIHIPVLDQGRIGSCAGDTGTEELASDPIWQTLPSDVQASLNQDYAYKLYSDATKVDPFQGTFTYPPPGGDDTGTNGLAIQKVLKKRKLIRKYRWAFSVFGVVSLLQHGAVAMGIPWHQGMFTPDAQGFVHPTGPIAGGHEILIWKVEVANSDTDFHDTVFTVRNHWSASWGDAGNFRIYAQDLQTIIREGADFKQGVPLQ